MENNNQGEPRLTDLPHSLDELSRTNDADERKLWFDYVKTLNERQLQVSQRTGVTTYVLLATLVGLFYRFGPRLPQFVTQPDNVRASLVVFALLTIVLSSFLFAIAAVEMYLIGESDFRAAPKSSEHSIPVLYGIFAAIGAAFVSFLVWIAISSADHFRRYVLLVYALWMTVNVVGPILSYRRLAKKAKDIKNPLPRFSIFRHPPWANLIGCVLMLIWLVLGGVAVVRYLKLLPNCGLQPFKAASLGVITISIVSYMVLRSLSNASQYRYFGLERDIVLNRMTPAEIRERYLRDLSGPDMAQWLDDAFVTLDLKEEYLKREHDAGQEKLKEIASINAEYRIERKERAEAVRQKLKKAIDDCVSQYEVLTFQTRFFFDSYTTHEEREALGERFTFVRKKIRAFKEKLPESFKLLDELKKLGE